MNKTYPANIGGLGAVGGSIIRDTAAMQPKNGEPLVMIALKSLSEMIAAQEGLLGDLSQKLNRVLAPSVPEPESLNRVQECPNPEPSVSPLAMGIQHELNRVMTNNGVIQNLISRLEV